jgi:diguanylate cyclase (GGDEF)-like protein
VQPASQITLSNEDRQSLTESLHKFCTSQNVSQGSLVSAEFRQQITTFYKTHNGNKQALGVWVSTFLQELIPNLNNIERDKKSDEPDIFPFLLNLPYEEDKEPYKTLLAAVKSQSVPPLTPQRYLYLLQMAALLLELNSTKACAYLEELEQISSSGSGRSMHSLIVQMLAAKCEALVGHYLEEQVRWLDLILQACHYRNLKFLIHLLAQWVASLNWIRPNTLRRELLVSLLEANKQSVDYNQALVLFELFNLPDKSETTGDKHKYLNLLLEMPASLFTVDQLQNMYYFSGSIKSAVESSFKDSVSDFKHSNYYIHKYWARIGRINQFFVSQFTPAEYMEIQHQINQKTQALINLINTQSNAFVETLQSNYNTIDDLYHKVEELSLKDTLTGLHNRRYLYNNINELLLLAVRQQSPLSFVIIDIDDFKQINDTHGHLAGDFILSDMSNLLKGYFRKSDFIVRYGGEEFLIVLFNSDHMQAELTLDTLRKKILDYSFEYKKSSLHLTVSIGIASVFFDTPYASVDLEKLISEADAAMYESKNRGKNKITSKVFYY